MDTCREEPDAKARKKHNGQGEVFLEAKVRDKKKEDARHDPPQRAFGETLHDPGIAFVLDVNPHQDKGSGERHDPDQPRSRWNFLCDGRGHKDDCQTQNDFNQKLHGLLPPCHNTGINGISFDFKLRVLCPLRETLWLHVYARVKRPRAKAQRAKDAKNSFLRNLITPEFGRPKKMC